MTLPSGTFDPITYTVPTARLVKLSKSGTRKLYPGQFFAVWGLIGLFFAFLFAQSFWEDALLRWYAGFAEPLGISAQNFALLVFLFLFVLFFVALIALRRRLRAQHTDRFGIDKQVKLSIEENGLRIAGMDIEYFLKGPGIYQLQQERDGIVIVAGGLLFLVPDTAFSNEDHKSLFKAQVARWLTDEARGRSAEVLKSVE